MYGVTEQTNSVCLIIEDFYPYFYVKWNGVDNPSQEKIEELKFILNDKVESKKGVRGVKELEIVSKTDLKFYNDIKEKFVKITMESPKFISCLRDMFENSEMHDLKKKGFHFDNKTFESKVSFPLRYMIDRGIVGMSWITLPKNTYKLRDTYISNCQIELVVSYLSITAHLPEKEYAKIAPIRILSFDIEAAAKGGHFPQASKDPIIQISNYCIEFGKNNNEPFVNYLFSLYDCADIPGAVVYNFQKEDEMLRNWSEFIVKLDPDIIIGYNINYFDFPYLFDRAQTIGVKNFGRLSRIKSTVTKAKHIGTNSAKAFGNRDLISINMDGRSIIDMYLMIVKDHKLRSNTLNNVSFHFLGEQKEDVHHTMIYDLWNKDEISRKRLGMYCLKDAYLPWKLCEKLMIIYNYAEMCRVTCTPLSFILSRGQQIKVSSQLHRKALMQDYIIPNEKIKISEGTGEPGDDKGYEGASVLEPIPGFYNDPIVTLDFASLYPSIMIAHNLCYTTLVKPEDVSKYKDSDIFISSVGGPAFIREHIRKGILPIILEDLISARKKAKADLKETTDESIKAVLDGRQLALKISANSVYGFTGAQIGQLPCLQISSTVTLIGRSMIEKTRDYVESLYKKENGYTYDSTVIYGDTDSVMIKFGVKTLGEAMVLGRDASERISKEFKKPIKIEFEKVYKPYLLMKKKRYAGLIWTKLEKWDKIDMKGIESVRRDNCELVKELLDKVLKMLLLEENGVEKGIEYTKSIISDLLSGRVDLSKLVISKSISKKTEEISSSQGAAASVNKSNKVYSAKQAHVELAEKMKKRDEGTAPHIGDRVPYVMISGAKGSKNYENSEDPRFVLENDVPIDYNYYIENQLKKPILRLFEYVIKDADSMLFCKLNYN